jgi:acetylornithine deacetylase
MNRPSLREMIDRLVSRPSVSAVEASRDMGNRGVVELLAGWLDGEGWSVEILPIEGARADKVNLIATRGRGPGGLVLSGHADTVPYDEGKWSSDPFRATERDGKLFGLGTADMKAFFALAIEAARSFPKLNAPLILVATADEESGMDGARALVRAGRPKGRHALIGEPTGLAPIRMHKGCAMERLTLVGRSGHSSDPRYGVSALDGMHDAITAMRVLRDELARDHRHDALEPPTPTMNFGRVAGGDNPNRICASCELDYDVRVLPGMSAGDVRSEIEKRVAGALKDRGLAIEHRSLTTEVPPFETPQHEPFVRAVEELTGHSAGGVSFGTEAPFFTELGMSTIVLGPGDIAVAHQPDEHLPLDRIPPMLDILRALIDRYAVKGDA